MANQNQPRLTKAERTAAAREKARQLREQQQKKERRTKLLVRWGVVAAVVAIIAVVALIVTSSIRAQIPDAGPAPAHGNQYGGVTVTAGGALVDTEPFTADITTLPEETAAPGTIPSGIAAAPAGKPAQIVIYVDMLCPFCKQFEEENAGQLAAWRDSGAANIEYRVVSFLNAASTTNYSARAANAVAAEELISLASEAGAGDISTHVNEGTYRPYAQFTDGLARVDNVRGTPSVYVDGQMWPGTGNFVEFAQPILDARG
jgi:protein-disulfide isomerase